MKKQVKLTESELEILQVIWQLGKATVREVHEILGQHKDNGYTTTLKLMQIMYDKGLLKRNDSSKTHIYESGVNKEKVQQQYVGKMINGLFAGNPTALVMQALGNAQTSKAELEAIQQLLNNLKNK
jgi:BlaI family transcriptional regulator, penicillinase repressor